jgi:Fe2+ or Zn2+ uptake regulation protein
MTQAEYPTTDDLVTALRARGQRVTSQRLAVLRELRRRGGHVTAHAVYESVRAELPGTSSPTIYAVLELLSELGLARKLDLGLGSALYDARVEPHGHTVCRRCGAVADLDGGFDPDGAVAAARAGGFAAERVELVVAGVCASCAARRQ